MQHLVDDDYIRVGDVLADKYRVQAILGRGGMGMVVAAWHHDLQEHRAIKFMLAGSGRSREAEERFTREAQAAARLKTPHAVKIHDVARLADGVPYIVMEYLEGQDLQSILNTRGPLPLGEACNYIIQACEAIGEAHAKGMVHRDLKPANLFITKGIHGEPFVKVLDFGIAKVTQGLAGAAAPITATQSMMGTPAYMSPDQIISSKEVDARSDIWSLGVILYQLTTGRLPFDAEHAPVLFAKILDDRQIPPPPSTLNPALPAAFDRVVKECLQKSPDKRLPTIGDLVRALTPFSGNLTNTVPMARPSVPLANVSHLSTDSITRVRPSALANPAEASEPMPDSESQMATLRFEPERMGYAMPEPSERARPHAPRPAMGTPVQPAVTPALPSRAPPRNIVLIGAAVGVLLGVFVLVLVALATREQQAAPDSSAHTPLSAAPQTRPLVVPIPTPTMTTSSVILDAGPATNTMQTKTSSAVPTNAPTRPSTTTKSVTTGAPKSTSGWVGGRK